MHPVSARLELATLLRRVPDCWRSPHPLVTIRDAYALLWANPLWSRRYAVAIAFRANMEPAIGHGAGNRAKRREAALIARRTAA